MNEHFKKEVAAEIATILDPSFQINVTNTTQVPHSSDSGITFPNLDQKQQNTKFLETAVLYVDMRRSTQISLKHRPHTTAKLYSAFVRAMTRCATFCGAEVRGIIGDRVMVLFPPATWSRCAIDTAILMNSVCQLVIDKHFSNGDVKFGIGIDYGRMLATKTGVRKHGVAQHSYRSLVWLGRPANIASKLTDVANKDAEYIEVDKVRVGSYVGGIIRYTDEWPNDFLRQFSFDVNSGMMRHQSKPFHHFYTVSEKVKIKNGTLPILITEKVLKACMSTDSTKDYFKRRNFTEQDVTIEGYSGKVFGANLTYTLFNSK